MEPGEIVNRLWKMLRCVDGKVRLLAKHDREELLEVEVRPRTGCQSAPARNGAESTLRKTYRNRSKNLENPSYIRNLGDLNRTTSSTGFAEEPIFFPVIGSLCLVYSEGCSAHLSY